MTGWNVVDFDLSVLARLGAASACASSWAGRRADPFECGPAWRPPGRRTRPRRPRRDPSLPRRLRPHAGLRVRRGGAPGARAKANASPFTAAPTILRLFSGTRPGPSTTTSPTRGSPCRSWRSCSSWSWPSSGAASPKTPRPRVGVDCLLRLPVPGGAVAEERRGPSVSSVVEVEVATEGGHVLEPLRASTQRDRPRLQEPLPEPHPNFEIDPSASCATARPRRTVNRSGARRRRLPPAAASPRDPGRDHARREAARREGDTVKSRHQDLHEQLLRVPGHTRLAFHDARLANAITTSARGAALVPRGSRRWPARALRRHRQPLCLSGEADAQEAVTWGRRWPSASIASWPITFGRTGESRAVSSCSSTDSICGFFSRRSATGRRRPQAVRGLVAGDREPTWSSRAWRRCAGIGRSWQRKWSQPVCPPLCRRTGGGVSARRGRRGEDGTLGRKARLPEGRPRVTRGLHDKNPAPRRGRPQERPPPPRAHRLPRHHRRTRAGRRAQERDRPPPLHREADQAGGQAGARDDSGLDFDEVAGTTRQLWLF